jgi:hypothetical protein
MNDRERFSGTMRYRPVDRCPIRDFGFWEETLLVWKQYGLPQSVPEQISTDDFFGMDRARLCGGIVDLWPFFEEEVLEDKRETEIVRDRDGVVLERGMPAKRLGSALRACCWIGFRAPWALASRRWRTKRLQVAAWRAGLAAGSIRYRVVYL